MTSHSFKLKKYINDIGFYSSIELIVNTDIDSLKVEFNEVVDDPEWHPSVMFGILYFYEHYSKRGNKGLFVSVRNLHTMTGDSSHIVVFYVTVKCLCEALGYSHELIEFDNVTGAFTLEK
jgi:hypothetical protein